MGGRCCSPPLSPRKAKRNGIFECFLGPETLCVALLHDLEHELGTRSSRAQSKRFGNFRREVISNLFWSIIGSLDLKTMRFLFTNKMEETLRKCFFFVLIRNHFKIYRLFFSSARQWNTLYMKRCRMSMVCFAWRGGNKDSANPLLKSRSSNPEVLISLSSASISRSDLRAIVAGAIIKFRKVSREGSTFIGQRQ